MAKKYPHGYIKNPAKVAAGKARAAGAIKDKSGKYVSNIFYNEVAKTVLATKKVNTSKIESDQTGEINQLLKDAKVSKKEIADFYNKHQYVFESLLKKGTLKGTQLFTDKLKKKVEGYKGKIFINKGNGKIVESSKTETLYQLAKFQQYLSDNINVVAFSVKPTLTIDGKMVLQIPDAKQLVKDLKQYFGAKNIDELSEFSGAEITEAIQEILSGMYERKKDKKKDQSEYDILLTDSDEDLDLVIYAS